MASLSRGPISCVSQAGWVFANAWLVDISDYAYGER